MVIPHVGYRNQRRNFLDSGKGSCLLPVGMPDQDFIEEPEPLNGGCTPFLSFCWIECDGIDTPDIVPKGIVKRPYCINRLCHVK